MHKQITAIFLFLLFVLSCSTTSNSNGALEIEPQEYETYVIDSLSIPYLAELEILDYDERKNHLLVQSRQERAILIIDEAGEVLEKFYPFQEGPGYVGDFSYGWVFSGDDELISHSYSYFYRLKRNGDYVQRIPYPVEIKGSWMLDYNPEMLFSTSYDDKDYLIGFITEPAGYQYNSKAFQDSVDMIYKMELVPKEDLANLNPDYKPKAKPIMRKQANSVHRSLEAYVDRGWPYITKINDDLAIAVYSIDTVLYLFDLKNDNLVRQITIPSDFHPDYETVPFGSKEKPDRYRINATAISDGKHIILNSFNVVPESVMRNIQAQGSGWWESEAYQEAQKKYFAINRLVFDLEGNFLGKLTNGAGSQGAYKQSTSQGFYWVDRRYKEEKDHRTFLKLGIRPINTID